MEWNELIQDPDLQAAAARLGYRRPTRVQELVSRKVAEGQDLCVRAETGSGKTMAYLMPLFERYRDCGRENKVLILTPTHELAMQVYGQAKQLAERSGIGLRAAVLVGNVRIDRQIEKLREKPQILVGTPGRVLELIRKKKVAAHLLRTIVLDEGDRLFNRDNKEGTDAVIKYALRDRQLLLFSATLPDKAVEAVRAWASGAERLEAEEGRRLPRQIQHWYVVVEPRYKLETLRGLVMGVRTKKAMVFLGQASQLEEAAEKLLYHHYSVAVLGGERRKEERKKAVADFCNGKVKYLLATDLAARGLDFKQVDTVFHVSIPESAMDYLHRAGRTGRAGAAGRSILIVSPSEVPLAKRFGKELGIRMEEKFYYKGKLWAENPQAPN